MKIIQKQIEAWKNAKAASTDEVFLSTCDETIRKLKRRNFILDLLDIVLKACGILWILGGIVLFFFHTVHGHLFSMALDFGIIYMGYVMAKGLEK